MHVLSKQKLMEALAREVKTCRKCGLWQFRKNPVVGEGSLDTRVMFIGEAPGYWENIKGRPFVGAAGKLLDRLLLGIGLSRNEVYIGNVLKCRPPENRDPTPDEIKTCTPFLDRQVEIIKPKFIVLLGRHSTSYVFSKLGMRFSGITKVRGRVFEAELLGLHMFIIPMFHPAAALYNAKYRDFLERDFKILKVELEKHECF